MFGRWGDGFEKNKNVAGLQMTKTFIHHQDVDEKQRGGEKWDYTHTGAANLLCCVVLRTPQKKKLGGSWNPEKKINNASWGF